jgi:hypothetical protein
MSRVDTTAHFLFLFFSLTALLAEGGNINININGAAVMSCAHVLRTTCKPLAVIQVSPGWYPVEEAGPANRFAGGQVCKLKNLWPRKMRPGLDIMCGEVWASARIESVFLRWRVDGSHTCLELHRPRFSRRGIQILQEALHLGGMQARSYCLKTRLAAEVAGD